MWDFVVVTLVLLVFRVCVAVFVLVAIVVSVVGMKDGFTSVRRGPLNKVSTTFIL